MTKTPKKNTKKSGEKLPPQAAPKEPPKSDEDDKPFDFGGLPNRDLKKNLGCG